MMIELTPVQPAEGDDLRQLAEDYWAELMPKATVLKDQPSRDRYFADSFRWEGEQDRPYWALRAGERVGFVTLPRNDKSTYIDDFYPTASMGCPPLVFLQLLLGYRNIQELSAIYPDVSVAEKYKLLVATLFPQQQSRVHPL